MLHYTLRHQSIIALLLALLMLVTRGHHDLSPVHLPDASWAVFFLAGLYLRPNWLFAAYFLLAASMDYVAITWGGVSSFCVTNAYFFLIPAYWMLWFAGRSYSPKQDLSRKDLLPLALYALAGTLLCELLSSGGFYFFSGRYVDPTLDEFVNRLATYLPGSLTHQAIYLGLAALVHSLFYLARNKISRRGSIAG
jgi:hypothetical protein